MSRNLLKYALFIIAGFEAIRQRNKNRKEAALLARYAGKTCIAVLVIDSKNKFVPAASILKPSLDLSAFSLETSLDELIKYFTGDEELINVKEYISRKELYVSGVIKPACLPNQQPVQIRWYPRGINHLPGKHSYLLVAEAAIIPPLEVTGITAKDNRKTGDPAGVETQSINEHTGNNHLISETLQNGIIDAMVSETRYRYIFSKTAEGLFTADKTGKFLDANPAFVQLINAVDTEHLIKSKATFQSILTNSRKEADELFLKVQKNQLVHSQEKEIYRPDGKSIWVKFNISAVKNINGMNDHFIGMVEDVTATRQAYRFVSESESYLRAMFECAKQGYIIVDADYTVIRFNQIAEHFLLAELGIDLGKSLRLTADFDNTKSETFFESVRAATAGRMMNYLERTMHPDGSESWYDMTMVPIYSEKGDQLGLSISILNVTHVKQYEKTMHEKMLALEKTNQELDKFVYSVSHDLRSPLTSILGIINIAQVEKMNNTQQRYLDLMEQSVQRLDQYIQDILDYTRNSRMEQKVQKVDFNSLLEIIRNNLNFLTDNNKVRLKVHLAEKSSFFGDEIRLKIILQNLISNAIKYRDNNKPECHISMKIEIGDEEVLISVADNGIGIPKEHLEKIFDMFYRVDYRQTGSGLGLYITKESVLKLNGSIEVDSMPGEGTVFQLKVPNNNDYEQLACY